MMLRERATLFVLFTTILAAVRADMRDVPQRTRSAAAP
jgi:hypothetical protein